MKKFVLSALGIAILFMLAIPAFAQVQGEFERIVIRNEVYMSLEDINDGRDPNLTVVDYQIIDENDFGLLPNYVPKDLDDGYALIDQLPFPFGFNGEVYNQVWVCINGFISFGNQNENGLQTPPFLPAKEPLALFRDATNFPVNVIAPFWGDHHYRTAQDQFLFGFMESQISYMHVFNSATQDEMFIVEWKDLNINYYDEVEDEDIVSSVGDFQVILYKSKVDFTDQGDIQFRYGQVGGNPFTDDTRIITRGAAIGIKGEGKIVGDEAEFLNGLAFINPNDYDFPQDSLQFIQDANDLMAAAEVSERLSNEWRPSGGDARTIYFENSARFNLEEWWGDGDVDLSKVSGRRHFGLPQSRFVTTNDIRLVLVSVATKTPLDPVRRRAAYHADVDHDGRYYFNDNEQRVNIPTRSEIYTDDLPAEVSSARQILFEADEMDASIMLRYLSGRVPELPYVIDTNHVFGKVNPESIATGFKLGSVDDLGNNNYRLPIYTNKDHNGEVAIYFEANAKINNVEANNTESSMVMAQTGGDNVVIAASGQFASSTPLAYVEFNSTSENINLTNVRFNKNDINNVNFNVTNVEDNNVSKFVTNSPNPFVTNTNFNVNVLDNGVYTLNVFDMNGRLITTVHNGELEAGSHNFTWFGTDNNGHSLENGMYIYKFEGNTISETGKIIINK